MKTKMLKIKDLLIGLDQASNDDEEAWKKSQGEQKDQYQRRLESLIIKDEEIQKAQKDEKSRRGRKENLKVEDAVDEEPTEDEAVGEPKVRVQEQSSGKPSPKTQRKPKFKGPEEDIHLKWSPIVQKIVDEEVEKRLMAKQSLTRRLFQEEFDEEGAKLQYEESMKKMKQASDRM